MPEDKPELGQVGSDTAQVFISYASADGGIANAVCAALEREGVRCWIAPRDVTPGELYAANIVRAIDTTQVVVLVLSQHAADSAHVLREVERASSKHHAVLSFRIDQAPLPDGLEYFLNSSQWLDASATGAHRELPRLVDAVKTSLGKPAVTAPVTGSPFAAARAGTRSNRKLLALAVLIAAALAYVGVDRLWLSERDDPRATSAGETAALPSMSAVSANTIAVMPFVNMSSDKEQEYFSDGLSEELLNLLAKVSDLRVAARTSSFYYKGKDITLAEVARELQVEHVLEGSVRKSGNRVRITAQLIRTSDGYHQWSETYDRTLDDIFAVQKEIAAAVVAQLEITLLGAPPKIRTTTPEAYALYLEALQLERQGTMQFDERVTLYKKVLALDPNYVPAWFGLGLNYGRQGYFGDRIVDELIEKARQAMHKALEIDPQYALAHAGLGWIALNYDHDLAAAAQHFERAITLDPADLFILNVASELTTLLGRSDADVALWEYAVSRDPMDPGPHASLGGAYLDAGRLDESIASNRAALKLSPVYVARHAQIGDAFLLKGDYEAALKEYESEPIESLRLAGRAVAYHAQGRASESDEAVSGLIEMYKTNSATLIASVFVYRNDFDSAFEWLEKAVANREGDLNIVPTNIWLKQLHADPRWLPFLRKIGKAPEQLPAIEFELKVPTH